MNASGPPRTNPVHTRSSNRRAGSASRFLTVVAVAAIVVACGSPAPLTASQSAAPLPPSPSPSSPTAIVVPSASPAVSPSASPAATPSPSPVIDLTKKPFTVLVLGSDWGYRTDAVIVAGVDPVNRRLSFASIPRDTIDVPMPDGGRFGQRKINEYYRFAKADPKHFPGGPAQATKEMVGRTLGLQIDYYAWTSFTGFENLVDTMGGVKVNVPNTIFDPKYQITAHKSGVRFKAGPQVMKGSRALIYVRTRGGDNDFERARRQQLFLTSAGSQLVANRNLLAALLTAQPRNLATDFPLAGIPGLLSVFGSSPKAPAVEGVVLGPRTYSSKASCSCGYALEPNLAAMRKAAARLFPWAVRR